MTTPMEKYDACVELQRSGKPDEATDALKRLSQEEPDFALTFNALAADCKKKGLWDDAISYAEKYCELEPDDAFGYSILSAYCIEAGQRDKAEEALGRAHDIRFRNQFGDLDES